MIIVCVHEWIVLVIYVCVPSIYSVCLELTSSVFPCHACTLSASKIKKMQAIVGELCVLIKYDDGVFKLFMIEATTSYHR